MDEAMTSQGQKSATDGESVAEKHDWVSDDAEARKAIIRGLWLTHSVKEIRKALKRQGFTASVQTVENDMDEIAEEANDGSRPDPKTPIDSRIRELHEAGLTKDDIAEDAEVNVSVASVEDRLDRVFKTGEVSRTPPPPVCEQEYYILQAFNPGDLLSINHLINQTGLKQIAIEKYLSRLALGSYLQRVENSAGVQFRITSKGLRVSGRVEQRERKLGDTKRRPVGSTELGDTKVADVDLTTDKAAIQLATSSRMDSLLVDYPKDEASVRNTKRNTECNTESPSSVIQNVIRPQKRKIGRPSLYELDSFDADIKRLYPDHSGREIAWEIGCHRNMVSKRVTVLIKKGALQPKPSHEAAMKREQSRKAKAINQTINHGRTKPDTTGEQSQNGQEAIIESMVKPMVKPSVQSSNGSKLMTASSFIEEVRKMGAERGFECGFRIEYDDIKVDAQGDGLTCRISMEATVRANGDKKGVR